MSVYDDANNSVDDGSPIELYSFVNETYQFFYTNNHSAITFAGNVFSPLHISRDPLAKSIDIVSAEQRKILVPLDCPLAAKYGLPYAPPDFRVRIWRKHRDVAEYRKVFFGDSIAYNVTAEETFEITCVDRIQMIVNRLMAAAKYGRKCNHHLFDNRCKVARADYTWTTEVVAISGASAQFIEVANDHNPNGRLELGDVIINGELRLILRNEDNVLKVRYPFTEINVGDEVTIVIGCRHNKFDCIDKFDNFVNFGGFPLTPIAPPVPVTIAPTPTGSP